MPNKNQSVKVYMDDELRSRVLHQAEAEQRSVAAIVRLALEDYLNVKDYLDEQAGPSVGRASPRKKVK